jgi:DNA-binding PucR family transcriptional regulator
MIRFGGLMLALLLVAQGRPAPGKVNSTFDKAVDFKTFQTYGWIAGQNAFDPAAHKAIVAAIDAEMASLGLKKVEGRAGQVTVRYLAVRSTSVDLDKLEALERKGADPAGADVTVGRLVIALEDAKSNRRLWAADSVEPVDPKAADREDTVKRVVARMFETYPTRAKAK